MPEIEMRVNVEQTANGSNTVPGAVLVYATFPDVETAESIGAALVEARLAACANVFPGMRSTYRWQGKIEHDTEAAAFLKTRPELVPRIVGWLRIAHPYVNPAAVAIPCVSGSADFLAWIAAETEPARCG
ncbi:MAG: divalent-cation tolerance protein CutA [Hyphomicrobiaceae bacterium]